MKNSLQHYINIIFLTDSLKNKDFQHMNIRRTSARGLNLTIFIVIIEIFMIVVSFVAPTIYELDQINLYRIHYLTLIFSSLIGIYILRYFTIKSPTDDKPLYFITIIVVSFSILWGGSVTLLDLTHNPQISVYLTFVLLMAIAPILAPHIMLPIYIIIHTLFILAIPYYQSSQEIIFSTRLNSTIFIFFTCVISRILYKESYNGFLKDQLIASQNKDLINSNNQLHKISRQDSLTLLYNRLSLDDILDKEWHKAVKNNELISILMIDIDSFKVFNDTYGHIKGDECLINVSKILNSVALKNKGFAFRYGGDEFCLLFRNISENDIHSIIRTVTSLIDILRIDIDANLQVPVKLSIGFSCEQSINYTNPWHLIDLADQHLYKIKSLK